MDRFKKYCLVLLISTTYIVGTGYFVGCTSTDTESDESELSLDSETASADDPEALAEADAESSDPEAESSAELTEQEAVAANEPVAPADEPAGEADEFAEFSDGSPATNDSDLAIDETVTNAEPQLTETTPPAPPTEEPNAVADPMATTPAIPDEPVVAELPADTPAPTPEIATTEIDSKPATITGLKYKRNDTGGTVIVESNVPVTYTTRVNKDLNQLVVEIPNAKLPSRLERPLDTRDFVGAIGKVNAYHDRGSNSARIVIQLRNGAQEPFISQEANTLLITANDVAPGGSASVAAGEGRLGMSGTPGLSGSNESSGGTSGATSTGATNTAAPDVILPNKTLAEFLSTTQEFYGRRISIETNEMEVRDALRFLSEESGINMIVSEAVGGKIGLKLRQVPWDQALVVIMRAKNLGYLRQGNILRIAPLSELQSEESSLLALQIGRRQLEPTTIRVFRLSYSNAEQLAKTISSLMNSPVAASVAPTPAGTPGSPPPATIKPTVQVVSDSTSNSIIVTATKDDLDRVSRIVSNFDTPPPQVLIEGKIVEAGEAFIRSVGVNWGLDGGSAIIGRSINGPIFASPSVKVGSATNGYMNFNLNVGALDILGDLNASLSLFEVDDKIKILSSPKLVTLAGKKASISSIHQIPQRTVTLQQNAGSLDTISGVESKISLEVTPLVTADNSINMQISVQRDIPQPPQENGTVLKDSRTAQTEVLVKNGQTAVLGGIYQTDETDGIRGVPVLKDIPVIGYLFKSKITSRTKNELLIFVTPRIISGGDASTMATISKDL
ncbi:MAG: type IV pilus secretin PilQ [Bdellovibrionota bacterium]